MNVAEYKHQPFGEDLAQFGEIVLHNLIESMRVQDIVDVGEYVVDVALVAVQGTVTSIKFTAAKPFPRQ